MGIIKSFTYLHVISRFPPLGKLLRLYKPKKFIKDIDDHRRLVKEKLERRMKIETTRPDFVAYALYVHFGAPTSLCVLFSEY